VSRPYAPRAFLRHVPPDLLRQFCDGQRIPLDLDWSALADGDVDPVYDAWLALPAADRERAEAMFRHVHEMATPFGVRTLVEEAVFQEHAVPPDLDELDGHHAKALWALLHYAPVFHTARVFVHSANLPSRYWRKRTGLPRVAPDSAPAARTALQNALADFYRREQGRGQRVTVEHYPRQGKWHYFFAYPDDYTGIYIGHNALGRLQRVPQRPAFEVVFVYDPAAGSLDLYAQGDKRVRAVLEDAFCEHILRCEPAAAPSKPAYELNGLLDPGFWFPHDPADGVREVRVRRLRVAVAGSNRRLILEADPGGPPGDVHAMIDEWVNTANVPRSRMLATQATLAVTYLSAEDGRERTLTFTVSHPDSCDLKGKPEEQRDLGDKYLRRWGIARG
jgi:hypothetical protein